MAQFAVPPISPPHAPREGSTLEDVVLWSKRVSGYLIQSHQFTEQNAEAYISSSTQLGTDLIGTDNIIDSSITSAKIEDSGITATDLGPSAVTTVKIQNGAVITQKLEDSAVTTVKIEALAVTTAKLADSSVTTVKIENSAVTNAELVTITTDAATAHATVGASVVVSYSISRDKKPMVVPQVSAAGWLASLSYVATNTVEITAFNNSGATSCTVYANYH